MKTYPQFDKYVTVDRKGLSVTATVHAATECGPQIQGTAVVRYRENSTAEIAGATNSAINRAAWDMAAKYRAVQRGCQKDHKHY